MTFPPPPHTRPQILADFGHSLTVLSRKGLKGIEREMRDLALLLGAAGIVQVP